jgi:hypothetical protein
MMSQKAKGESETMPAGVTPG